MFPRALPQWVTATFRDRPLFSLFPSNFFTFFPHECPERSGGRLPAIGVRYMRFPISESPPPPCPFSFFEHAWWASRSAQAMCRHRQVTPTGKPVASPPFSPAFSFRTQCPLVPPTRLSFFFSILPRVQATSLNCTRILAPDASPQGDPFP